MQLSGEQIDNWQQQLDEILALESIYEENFEVTAAAGLTVLAPGGGTTSQLGVEMLSSCLPPQEAWAIDCMVSISVEPESGRIALQIPQASPAVGATADAVAPPSQPARSHHNSPACPASFSVRFLPPISLQLRLHPGYPSQQPPQILDLSSAWLSPAQQSALQAQLAVVWEEQGPGLPICFTWADWLQGSSLQHLGQSDALQLGQQSVQGAGVVNNGEDSRVAGGERGVEKGVDHASLEKVVFKLLRYDAACEHREFQQAQHTCHICFEDKAGASFARLDCRHHFCTECIGEQARVHVREGSLEHIRCPEPKCGAPMSPQVLRRVLSPEEFARWEQLTLQKTLDRMADAAYCPRCSTVSLEDEDNCAQCSRCFFVFCSLCNESWHPGTKCVSAETRLEMLKRKMEGGGHKSVQELRRKAQEMQSLATIEATSKQCPRCSMAIQKSEGCNKMTCTNCGAFFCFICNREIRGYEHFKNKECVLFDEAEILRWEQQWEDRVERAAFGEARNDFFMQQQMALLEQGGGGQGRGGAGGLRVQQLRGCACPQCGQVNYKIGNNNHMNCWSCTSHFCYLCRQVLRGKGSGGAHFGPKGCKQHSAD